MTPPPLLPNSYPSLLLNTSPDPELSKCLEGCHSSFTWGHLVLIRLAGIISNKTNGHMDSRKRRGLDRNRRWEGDPASGSLSHHRSVWRQMTGRHDPLTLCPHRRSVPQHVSAGQIWPNIHYLNDGSQAELWHTFTFNIILFQVLENDVILLGCKLH